MILAPLSAEVEAQLEEDDPELLSLLRARRTRDLDKKYPKPDQSDIEQLRRRLDDRFQKKRDDITKTRQQRYLTHKLPEKMAKSLKFGEMYHSGLSNNEIRRVVAILTGNLPKVTILPAGISKKAQDRADQQTRWANELLPAFERRYGHLLRPFADALAEDGFAIFEFFLTGTYEDLATDYREVGGREETKAEYDKRMSRALTQTDMPFGIRVVDPLAVRYDPDIIEGGCVLIVEQKPRRHVINWLMDHDPEKADALRKPQPSAAGGPSNEAREGDNDTVETVRYYDRRWMSYLVGGELVQCEEHTLPMMPVVIAEGMVSSSSNMSERVQGILYGMLDDERLIDYYMTARLDRTFRFATPKLALKATDPNAQPMVDGRGRPISVNFDSDEGAPYIAPGYDIVDATKDFRPVEIDPMLQILASNFQHKGLNPVSQGESPGADPAGYTVNMLDSNSQRMYEVIAEAIARAWGQVIDLARLTIRDCPALREQRVYLSAPMTDRSQGGTEWLGLGPDDIDETPAKVTIDPKSDQSRMARIQVLTNGMKAGIVPEREVQIDGYGADDPSEWNRQIVLDEARRNWRGLAVQDAMQRIRMGQQAAQQPQKPGGAPGLVDQYGNVLNGGLQAAGAVPATPQPPTVPGGGGNMVSPLAGQAPANEGVRGATLPA